ncbi:MAG TPA: sulfotransferase [Caulobacteraceae bacterium]|jgi:tetratricopeptide (TPR) repeat protein
MRTSKPRSAARRPGSPRDPAGASRWLDQAAGHVAAGRLAEASAAYAQAAEADPDDFRAPLSLATLDLRAGRPDRALPRLRRAVALRPDLYDAQHNLGAVAQTLELWDEAAVAYEAALALRPDAVETRRNVAVVLAVIGRITEAETQHRRLAAQPATRLWALTRLALLRADAIDDAELADMRAAAAAPQTGADTRIGLWFAIGEVLERRGEPNAAFAAFAEGNRRKRQSLLGRPQTDPPSLLRAHALAAQQVRTAFSADFVASRQGQGLSTPAPIFIVGMPRSGSTLIEQILAAHPDVTALGETAVLPRLLEGGALGPGAGQADLRRLGRAYLEAIRARGWRGAGRFVDKTLETYLHVGAVALMFPRAVILHAVRDPMDACLSCYRQLFATGAETLYDLAEIGAEYVTYRRMMEHWRAVLSDRVVGVDHEALVDAPEAQIRWLVTEACGLAWNDACLAFHTAAGAVRTASSAQVRQPIFRTSLGRWRRYEAHLGPLMEALGPYAPKGASGGA